MLAKAAKLLLCAALWSCVYGVPLKGASFHDGMVNRDPMVRGVNLGGWLVLEPWIVPKLFESANAAAGWSQGSYWVVDEWTWWAHAPSTSLAGLLEAHWASWVTKDHLTTLQQAGISHLRIPVGYWYFEDARYQGEPFANGVASFPKALAHLETLVNVWAKDLGLKVLIDIHGAPGSQNGFDNSGKRGDIDLLNGSNLTRWANVVAAVANWTTQTLDKDTLWGIEILNEPAGFYEWMWTAITTEINPTGYANVRNVSSDVNVIFQTGFHPVADQPDYPEPAFHNLWFDDHQYQCFGDDWNRMAYDGSDGWDKHLSASCAMAPQYASAKMWTVVGEFSLAVTDCAKYLSSGMNAGCDMTADPHCQYVANPTAHGHPDTCTYYTQPAAALPADYKAFLAKFAAAQMDAFEAGNGWFFWNFRTEDGHAPAWDFLLGLQEGWIAPNVANRTRFC